MKKQFLFIVLVISLTFAPHFIQSACGTDFYDNLIGKSAPDFSGEQWLNTPPITLADLKGKIVLLDFWDYSSSNCVNAIQYLNEWHKRYSQYGLVIIGIHAPVFDFAKDAENVKEALDALGVKYPVVLDNDREICKTYNNVFWPRKLLLARDGTVLLDHVGEGRYSGIEKDIRSLILKQQPDAKFPEIMSPIRGTDVDGIKTYPTTHELFAGTQRGAIGNEEGFQEGTPVDYKDPGKYGEGKIYLNGKWLANHESLTHQGSTPTITDYIGFRYQATDVNAVLESTSGEPIEVFIAQNGKPLTEDNKGSDVVIDENGNSYVLVSSPRMYNLVSTKDFKGNLLHLFTQADGLSLYVITFGTCRAANPMLIPKWLHLLE